MFLLFTPYTYLFTLIYLMVLMFLFTISNFYVFWLYIELLTLLFMGIRFTLFVNRYSQLILYFLIQTIASFNILVFYILGYSYLFLFSLLLKLAMFPFFFWYINVLYRFPNFIFFFVRTFHKLPPLLLLHQFYDQRSVYFIIVSVIFTLLFGGFYMLVISDMRYLLIVSSMVNNSWLVMAMLTGNFSIFILFFLIYSINLFLLVALLNNFSKFISTLTYNHSSYLLVMFVLLVNMAGLPPIPMFLSKFLVIYNFLIVWDFEMLLIFPVVLFSNVIIMIRYIQCYLKYLVNVYTSLNTYLIY